MSTGEQTKAAQAKRPQVEVARRQPARPGHHGHQADRAGPRRRT